MGFSGFEIGREVGGEALRLYTDLTNGAAAAVGGVEAPASALRSVAQISGSPNHGGRTRARLRRDVAGVDLSPAVTAAQMGVGELAAGVMGQGDTRAGASADHTTARTSMT